MQAGVSKFWSAAAIPWDDLPWMRTELGDERTAAPYTSPMRQTAAHNIQPLRWLRNSPNLPGPKEPPLRLNTPVMEMRPNII